jgi:hypothetical protein
MTRETQFYKGLRMFFRVRFVSGFSNSSTGVGLVRVRDTADLPIYDLGQCQGSGRKAIPAGFDLAKTENMANAGERITEGRICQGRNAPNNRRAKNATAARLSAAFGREPGFWNQKEKTESRFSFTRINSTLHQNRVK